MGITLLQLALLLLLPYSGAALSAPLAPPVQTRNASKAGGKKGTANVLPPPALLAPPPPPDGQPYFMHLRYNAAYLLRFSVGQHYENLHSVAENVGEILHEWYSSCIWGVAVWVDELANPQIVPGKEPSSLLRETAVQYAGHGSGAVPSTEALVPSDEAAFQTGGSIHMSIDLLNEHSNIRVHAMLLFIPTQEPPLVQHGEPTIGECVNAVDAALNNCMDDVQQVLPIDLTRFAECTMAYLSEHFVQPRGVVVTLGGSSGSHTPEGRVLVANSHIFGGVNFMLLPPQVALP